MDLTNVSEHKNIFWLLNLIHDVLLYMFVCILVAAILNIHVHTYILTIKISPPATSPHSFKFIARQQMQYI